jgi:hypothetical protein
MAELGRGWSNGAPLSKPSRQQGFSCKMDRQIKESDMVNVFAAATVPIPVVSSDKLSHLTCGISLSLATSLKFADTESRKN